MQFNNQKIELVTKADTHFFLGLLGLLGSLAVNSWVEHIEKIRVIDYGLNDDQVNKIKIIGTNIGLSLEIIAPVQTPYSPRPEENSWFSNAIFAFLQRQSFSMGDPERIIYAVDSDVLFVGEPISLPEVSNDTLLACPDFPPLDLAFQIHGPGSGSNGLDVDFGDVDLKQVAFNAGVLISKRKTFLEILNKSEKFTRQLPQLYTNDQAVLNLAVANHQNVKLNFLPQSYNWRPKFNRAPKLDSFSFNNDQGANSLESQYFGKIMICHFCGRPKPWNDISVKGYPIWKHYYDHAIGVLNAVN